ncbi:Uncharacterized protein AXF42_Ash020872 [Apostasia shenzhenica]|uniref:Cyanobacterial aminoacyl-tRNA synthetase CAAD domain-containing protein n=1 Tax=Apostasia shenzhenica TaxID=1088818 RepID=A0A2H9ZS04_9ASPA|nr:Uncharacterized protein AXF42_Ash020872 [Apostasia shenzhenica]
MANQQLPLATCQSNNKRTGRAAGSKEIDFSLHSLATEGTQIKLSMASAAAAVAGVRLPSATAAGSSLSLRRHSPLLLPSPRRSIPSAASRLVDEKRFPFLKIRATSSEETSISIQTEDLLEDLKEKWDSVENKSTIFVYGGGAIVAVWLSSIVIGAINSVPLLPKLMELVGLGYTGWFVYRYLLFKSSRKELAEDIESLKKKIAGTE